MQDKALDKTSKWTFLTNHAHVILCLSQNPTMRVRDLAEAVGITERAVQHILHDLVEDEYLEVERFGRRNTYNIVGEKHLRHSVENHKKVLDLLEMIHGSMAPKFY